MSFNISTYIRSKEFINFIIKILIDEGDISFKIGNKLRNTEYLSDIYYKSDNNEFDNTILIERECFNMLVEKVEVSIPKPKIEVETNRTWRKVWVTLRYLEGGSARDICLIAGIARSTMHKYLWEVRNTKIKIESYSFLIIDFTLLLLFL